MMIPCPDSITGRFASAISSAAFATSAGSGNSRGLYPFSSTFLGQTNSAFCWKTSRGMSTSTGPGRPVDAMWNASRMTLGISATSSTR